MCSNFASWPTTLGATLGCSRPIADAGWLPKSRQVGQSGKTASACKLYVAMGISGAIQHLAGMKHVSTIVAVNSDAGASIFSIAQVTASWATSSRLPMRCSEQFS